MKFSFRQLLSIAMLCCASTAQVNAQQNGAPTKTIPGTRIVFERKFPLWMKKAMPVSAKSLFRGSFSLAKNQNWSLHLFNPDLAAQCGEENVICALQLQLFQRDARGVGILKRSVRFSFEDSSEPKLFGAQLLWLDAQKTRPILKLDAFERLTDGDIGDHILATFFDANKQFPSSLVVQRVRFGRWVFGDSSGQDIDFSKRDANGILQLHALVLSTGELPATAWNATWNGRQWTSHKPPDVYVNSFLLVSEPLQK